MGKRLTVAELSQQLEASHVSYQKLLDEVASLKATLVATPAVPAATVASATPRAYTPRADITCPKCGGTGFYDQATGSICFQCEGKGIQTDADQRRNWGYRASHKPASRQANDVPAKPAKPAYVAPAPTEASLAYRERLAAAKAAAIAGKTAVLV